VCVFSSMQAFIIVPKVFIKIGIYEYDYSDEYDS